MSRPCTVLLVQEDPLLRDASSSVLEAIGYSVVTACTGVAALSTLIAHPVVDVLLSDVGLLGDMDGHQLAERAHGVRPDIGVVLASGDFHRHHCAQKGSRSAGGKAVHLPKPFDRQGLLEALEQAVKKT